MNENRTVDPRTRKTKRAIRNAFAQLLSEKDMDEITVRDIAELAEINRKTFYRYYSGIYQVIDEIEDDIVQSFESVLGDINFRYELKNPYLIFERLTAVINTDIDFYGHLLSVQKNASLVTKVIAMVKEHTKKAIMEQIEIDEDFADVILEYSITGMIAVYQQWFISGRRDSIGRLSDIINVLSFQGFTGALEEYNNNRFGIVQKNEINHSRKDSL
jgi:AcrR family transcriptional regulator